MEHNLTLSKTDLMLLYVAITGHIAKDDELRQEKYHEVIRHYTLMLDKIDELLIKAIIEG